LYVDVVVNVRVISRLVDVKPSEPVQRQVPPEVGCGPNCTVLPEETVTLETFCQAPPLTRRYGFTGVAAQPPEELELLLEDDDELELEEDELLLEELEEDDDPVPDTVTTKSRKLWQPAVLV
jgi:hypothetical protein